MVCSLSGLGVVCTLCLNSSGWDISGVLARLGLQGHTAALPQLPVNTEMQLRARQMLASLLACGLISAVPPRMSAQQPAFP
jgi:hypothetical protein